MKIPLLLLLTLLALPAGAQTKKISAEPVATNVALLDDLILNQFNGSAYTTKRISVSNFVALPNLIFDGDSLTADGFNLSRGEDNPHYAYIPSAGYGNDWPDLLMSKSNYVLHSMAWNYARGGETATNTVANRFATNAALGLALQGPKMYFCNLGFNDINVHESPYEVTNALRQLWSWARASNATVVAFTLTTNTAGWSGSDQANVLVVNNWIRTNTTAWDYLVDAAPLQTNLTTQLYSDGIHWTTFFQGQIAEYINANVPSLAPVWGHSALQPPRAYKTVIASNVVATAQAVLYSATIRETLNSVAYDSDGLQFYYWTNANFGEPVSTIRSFRGSAGIYKGMEIQGSDIRLEPSGASSSVGITKQNDTGTFIVYCTTDVLITGGAGLKVGANGAAITNVLAVSGTLDFPSTGSMTNSDLSIAVTGGTTNDVAMVQIPPNMILNNSSYSWWLTNGLVWVRFNNYRTNAAQDPPSGLVNALIWKR